MRHLLKRDIEVNSCLGSCVGLSQSMLETVIPKSEPGYVLIVEGRHRGQVTWFTWECVSWILVLFIWAFFFKRVWKYFDSIILCYANNCHNVIYRCHMTDIQYWYIIYGISLHMANDVSLTVVVIPVVISSSIH